MKNASVRFTCLSAIVLISSLCADEGELEGQSISLISQAQKNNQVVVSKLKGVLLAPSPNISRGESEGSGFQAIDMQVPGGLKRLNKKLGPRFIGQPMTSDDMQELKRAIIFYYRDQGFPIVSVEIPAQKVAADTIKMVVIEGKMGALQIKGNRYFSDASIEGKIHQKKGEAINGDILMNDLGWLNRNPFMHANLFFTPGKNERETDVELMVEDRLPMRIYTGVDNTGVEVTEETRLWTGVNVRGILSDQVLSYQFTSAPTYKRFWSHTVNYLAPLPWQHNLTVFGGYSHTEPRIKDFISSGHSAQGSLRYDIPFKPTYKPFYHELSWGFDLKNIHNDLSFLSAQQAIDFTLATLDPTALTVFYKEPAVIIPDVVNKVVNLTQLYLGYRLSQEWETNRLECRAEGYCSPGKWLAHQENANFSQYHPGAVNHYIFGLLTIKDTWTLPRDFSFKFSFRGQISNENLIPSEQVGLGGYDTVRGYDEREVNYDDAICVNVEFHLPSFQILRFIKKYPDAFTFLGFFDFATGRNVHGYGEQQWQKLMSAGPGFRYKITDHLTARFDWGFRLHKIEFTNLGNKVHFGIMASF